MWVGCIGAAVVLGYFGQRGMAQLQAYLSTVSGQLLALAELDRGEIVPKRVFNLAGLMGRAARKKG